MKAAKPTATAVGGRKLNASRKKGGHQQRAAKDAALAEAIGEMAGHANAQDHAQDAAGVEQAERRGRRILRPGEAGQTPSIERRVQSPDEVVEAGRVEEARQGGFAHVVLEVVDVRAALEGQVDEDQHGEGQHHFPRPVVQQVGQILQHPARLLPGKHDALARGGKGDQKEQGSHCREDGHHPLEALHAIAVAQDQHQRQQQYLDDELRNHDRHEAVGREAVALGHAAGQHPAERGIRQVVGRIHQPRC